MISAPIPRQNRGWNRPGTALSPRRQTRYELHSPIQDASSGSARKYRRKSMAGKTKFTGSFTALVTPFKNGALDEAAFRGLVSWQIDQGSHGLVPVGTTGESPTLSHDEH